MSQMRVNYCQRKNDKTEIEKINQKFPLSGDQHIILKGGREEAKWLQLRWTTRKEYMSKNSGKGVMVKEMKSKISGPESRRAKTVHCQPDNWPDEQFQAYEGMDCMCGWPQTKYSRRRIGDRGRNQRWKPDGSHILGSTWHPSQTLVCGSLFSETVIKERERERDKAKLFQVPVQLMSVHILMNSSIEIPTLVVRNAVTAEPNFLTVAQRV